MKVFVQVLFLLISTVAFAQRSDDSLRRSLDEVVVTATRTPRSMGNVAIPISVISSKTLYQSGSLRLNDILAEQTGIQVIDNFGKGIQVQGLSSEYTLILIDGEPLIGRTAGVLDLSKITVRNIRKIEIVKGPSSSLYGSEAMGGVINIITDRSGQNKTDLGLRYARFNTLDGNLNFSRRLNKTDVAASLNYNSSKGYSLKPNAVQKTVEPFRRSTQTLSIQQQISENWKTGATFRANSSYIDNTIFVQNLGTTIASKGFEKNQEYNFTPYLQFNKAQKIKSTLRGYLTGFNALQQLDVKNVGGGYDDRFKQMFARVENQTDLQITENAAFTAGAGIVRETVSSNRYDTASTLRSNTIAYFFSQHEQKISSKLTLIGGVRFDANQAYASVCSPKIALQYKPSAKLKLNVSYGRGFKAPDFRQLYLNFTNLAAGAYSVFGSEVAVSELKRLSDAKLLDQTTVLAGSLSALKPEVSGGLNAGIVYTFNASLQITANVYRNDLKNMIVTDVIAYKKNGGQIFSYFNLKRALTQGIELGANQKIGKWLQLNAGYQYLYTADKDVLESIKKGEVFQRSLINGQAFRMTLSDYGGLTNRSRHSANLKFNAENDKGYFSTVRFIYRSRWGTSDLDGNGLINRSDEYAKGYLQVNASVGLPLSSRWKVMAGVDNIFNYKDILFLPGNPGRSAYVDIQFNF
jgi:outer membrane receptor for ferrienterochelin and colicins